MLSRLDKIVWAAALLVCGLAVVAVVSLSTDASGAKIKVSQRGQAFRPGEVTLNKDDALEILNDDGDLLHHAYIKSPELSFDSGDQAPGSRVRVVFPARGTFSILCAIHPRMRLNVVVK